jgi:hypothetical protein
LRLSALGVPLTYQLRECQASPPKKTFTALSGAGACFGIRVYFCGIDKLIFMLSFVGFVNNIWAIIIVVG